MKKYYEEHNNHQLLKDYDFLDSDLEVASLEEVVYASDEAPLIGTYNLKNGIAVILSNGNNEYILGHFTTEFNLSIFSMLNKINIVKPLKVIIVPGTEILSQSIEDIVTFLTNKNSVLLYNFEVEVINLQEYDNAEKTGIGFAYDTRSNKFLKPNYNEMLSSTRRS